MSNMRSWRKRLGLAVCGASAALILIDELRPGGGDTAFAVVSDRPRRLGNVVRDDAVNAIGLNSTVNGTERPVIKTFYQWAYGEFNFHSNEDLSLISAWQKAWNEVGWDTQILTMDDAKNHPDYEKYNEFLSGDPFGRYDSMCFWRWFAMASTGGGWMCDYDVFPLPSAQDVARKGELPHKGKMAVHGWFVPCLVSGDASEFDIMAKKLVESAIWMKKNNKGHWSDMLALKDLKSNNKEAFLDLFNVVPAQDIITKWPPDKMVCDKKTSPMGVHFSHHSIAQAQESGAVKEKEERSAIAPTWLRKLKEYCDGLRKVNQVKAERR